MTIRLIKENLHREGKEINRKILMKKWTPLKKSWELAITL
jgi:hypothetical protein